MSQADCRTIRKKTMKNPAKTSRFNIDDMGFTFVIVVWGGLLLSVFTQVL